MAFFGDGDDDDTRSDTPELLPNLAILKSSKTASLTCPSSLRLPLKRKAVELNSATAGGALKVRPMWLTVSPTERYLLLEDTATGDVLLPLIYMKNMFEANYSRKLSSLKHRLVTLPPEVDKSRGLGFIYWQWAFESPHEVKVLVRKLLGEENTPQGHLRLILLPIVFNAMANKPKLRSSPFFQKLQAAIQSSTYFPLLKCAPELDSSDATPSSTSFPIHPSLCPPPIPWSKGGEVGQGGGAEGVTWNPLSAHLVQEGGGRVQKMEMGEMSADYEMKLGGGWGRALGKGGEGGGGGGDRMMGATLNLMGNAVGDGWAGRGEGGGEGPGEVAGEKLLFHGPYDIEQTLAKYCLLYEPGGETGEGGNKLSGRTGSQAEEAAASPMAASEGEEGGEGDTLIEELKTESKGIRESMEQLRSEFHGQVTAVCTQLEELKQSLQAVLKKLASEAGGDGEWRRGGHGAGARPVPLPPAREQSGGLPAWLMGGNE